MVRSKVDCRKRPGSNPRRQIRRARSSRALFANPANQESAPDVDMTDTSDEDSDTDADEEEYSSDEYTNARVEQTILREYDKAKSRSLRAHSSEFTTSKAAESGPDPGCRTRKPVDYRERRIDDIPFRPPATPSKRRRLQASQKCDPVIKASSGLGRIQSSPCRPHSAQRAEEESRPHSLTRPFSPTQDGVDCWLTDRAVNIVRVPNQFTQLPKVDSAKGRPVMRAPGYVPPSNGHANNIVEEYLSPSDVFVEDFQAFKVLSDDEKRAVIQREAEEHGMEKPQGYSVSFHYNPHVEYHHFGSSHPMKPWRLTLTKQLVLAYGLEYCMELYEPRPATFDELAIFHDREYLSFLSRQVALPKITNRLKANQGPA